MIFDPMDPKILATVSTTLDKPPVRRQGDSVPYGAVKWIDSRGAREIRSLMAQRHSFAG